MQVVANSAHHDLAGVEAHPDAHLQAMGASHLLCIRTHGSLHGQSGVAGAQGVVFVGNGRPKQGHDAVAQHLLGGASKRCTASIMCCKAGSSSRWANFWIEATDEFGRVLMSAKSTVTCLYHSERVPGGTDLLGQVCRHGGE